MIRLSNNLGTALVASRPAALAVAPASGLPVRSLKPVVAFALRHGKTFAMAGILALGCSLAASAQAAGETFTPDATAYAGTITNTGTFVTSMISTYAPKAILISVAIGGVGLIWGWARRAVGH